MHLNALQWLQLTKFSTGVAVNLLMLLALVHICFPRARSRTRKFFEMSGYRPADKAYIQTWDDGYYIFFWTVIFTGLRVVTMDFLLRPLIVMTGIRSPKAQTRFAEQGWLFLYYSASWAMGMVSPIKLSLLVPCDLNISRSTSMPIPVTGST